MPRVSGYVSSSESLTTASSESTDPLLEIRLLRICNALRRYFRLATSSASSHRAFHTIEDTLERLEELLLGPTGTSGSESISEISALVPDFDMARVMLNSRSAPLCLFLTYTHRFLTTHQTPRIPTMKMTLKSTSQAWGPGTMQAAIRTTGGRASRFEHILGRWGTTVMLGELRAGFSL